MYAARDEMMCLAHSRAITTFFFSSAKLLGSDGLLIVLSACNNGSSQRPLEISPALLPRGKFPVCLTHGRTFRESMRP